MFQMLYYTLFLLDKYYTAFWAHTADDSSIENCITANGHGKYERNHSIQVVCSNDYTGTLK